MPRLRVQNSPATFRGKKPFSPVFSLSFAESEVTGKRRGGGGGSARATKGREDISDDDDDLLLTPNLIFLSPPPPRPLEETGSVRRKGEKETFCCTPPEQHRLFQELETNGCSFRVFLAGRGPCGHGYACRS